MGRRHIVLDHHVTFLPISLAGLLRGFPSIGQGIAFLLSDWLAGHLAALWFVKGSRSPFCLGWKVTWLRSHWPARHVLALSLTGKALGRNLIGYRVTFLLSHWPLGRALPPIG